MRLPPPPPPLPSKGILFLSSPSPAEKLPAPGFTRLLRGKSGRRRRERNSLSRSSPLFAFRSRTTDRASAACLDADAGDEPSSPKVTCIGQVRIRKKKRKKGTGSDGSDAHPKHKEGGKSRLRCWYLEKALLCSKFLNRRRDSAAPRRSIWRGLWQWLRFEGNSGYRQRKGSTNAAGSPLRILGKRGMGKMGSESEDEVENESAETEEETRVFVPPKNALVLMRCRSAPHNRCSALAAYPVSVSAPEEESGSEDDEENSSRANGGEEEERYPLSRPLFLNRCKSEPATKPGRLASPAADAVGGSDKRRCARLGVP
ncbi:hypothetical protein HPP92_000886 [Vanilla planifolia]|uniref:Uncharacterized protein n=1 Tax=Vanilla planifolia TaxID=51239 RepID=A0A835VHH1_VANPL|nr:hypothetical protein HPP92_000886 [Vanilla planifolia]